MFLYCSHTTTSGYLAKKLKCEHLFQGTNYIYTVGELRLGRNHTVREYGMSGESYSQKSGWIKHSNVSVFSR